MIVSAVVKLPCAPNRRPNDMAVASFARQSTFCKASATPAGPSAPKDWHWLIRPLPARSRRSEASRATANGSTSDTRQRDRRPLPRESRRDGAPGLAARQHSQHFRHSIEVEPSDDRPVRLAHQEAAAVRWQRADELELL